MFALVLQIPNENRTGFSIVHLYKRPRTENTACAKRVRPFAKIRTGESKSKLACILPGAACPGVAGEMKNRDFHGGNPGFGRTDVGVSPSKI